MSDLRCQRCRCDLVRGKRGPAPRFCKRCRNARADENAMTEGTCRGCGESFRFNRRHPQEFCSRSCYHESRKGQRLATWDNSPRACANPACVFGFIPAKRDQEFCSVECRAEGRRLLRVTLTYSGAHDRVRWQRGPASAQTCIDCGRPARQWSYDHADPDERHDPDNGWAFSVDPDHYDPRCIKCHKAFDANQLGARNQGETAR